MFPSKSLGRLTCKQQEYLLRNVAKMRILSGHNLVATYYNDGYEDSASITAMDSVLRCAEVVK
jgi:hypothetical protein